MASGKTWCGVQVRGTLMVCPTTMMSTMKTASSTRMQHIATATIVCSAWRADRTRPPSALPHRDVRRDEILIRWPLASLDMAKLTSPISKLRTYSQVRLNSYCVIRMSWIFACVHQIGEFLDEFEREQNAVMLWVLTWRKMLLETEMRGIPGIRRQLDYSF